MYVFDKFRPDNLKIQLHLIRLVYNLSLSLNTQFTIIHHHATSYYSINTKCSKRDAYCKNISSEVTRVLYKKLDLNLSGKLVVFDFLLRL